MIQIHLSRLLGEKRISMRELQRRTELGQNTIARLYHARAELVSLETVDRICRALDCEVGDLLEYVEE